VNAPPLRVVIADDHPVYRDGLAHLLNDLDSIDVVGVAADGQQAIDLAASLAPDIIIMDLRMPELDG
jgi:DNA-binding NarL/FixJ family response regulator